MLVLSRKLDEEILIGDNVRIKIIQIRGHQARLGIIAPKSISVKREELLNAPSPDEQRIPIPQCES